MTLKRREEKKAVLPDCAPTIQFIEKEEPITALKDHRCLFDKWRPEYLLATEKKQTEEGRKRKKHVRWSYGR